MNKFFLLLLSLSFSIANYAQNPSAGEIRQNIKKIGVLGSVLYFAAHPDDENTRIISYFSNEKLYETAYFSLTRGDGGQNLIGDEKGDLLGVIRTQELLQARNIDGGKQYFSRAVDFGYSKTVEETLTKWNEDSILYDAVWVIREFQPDIIITRFPPDDRAGHGHHTASAVIAIKAMDLAADPSVFPDQLERFSTWQVKRLFINTGKWWEPNIDSLYNQMNGKYAKVNVGEYNSVLGASYTEIAGKSRSQHKTQGFGSELSKGNNWEYLEFNKGEAFSSEAMEGVVTSWNRVGKYAALENEIKKCYDNFNENEPWKSIDQLIKIRMQIANTSDSHWKKIKTEEVNEIIASCMGLIAEVLSPDEMWVVGNKENLNLKVINRSAYPLKLKKIKGFAYDSLFTNTSLVQNEWIDIKQDFSLSDSRSSHPYWLRNAHDDFFQISDKGLTGIPEINIAPIFKFTFDLGNNELLEMDVPVTYKTVDRVKGEINHTVFISPEMIIHPSSELILFKPGEKKTIEFQVTSMTITGKYYFYPGFENGWIGPEKVEIEFHSPGKPQYLSIEVQAPNKGSELMIHPYIEVDDKRYDNDRMVLAYDHIEAQMMSPKVHDNLVSLDVTISGEHIAYFEGAGDEVPKMLSEMGYHVSMISIDDLGKGLSHYDAVIFGVRAYNVFPELANYHDNIMNYVSEGGRVVMQYNTSRGMEIPLGPYPFNLSRDRVTDENALTVINDPKDPILNYPNKITAADFDHWIQERGLYFASDWDSHYRSPLSWADPGEEPSSGSLIVTDYGKGVYVYTSISFFRQLPAGVPGAYRLFSNIISGGKKNKELEVKNDIR